MVHTKYIVVPYDRESFLVYKKEMRYIVDLFEGSKREVPGDTHDIAYLVDLEAGICTCDDYYYRNKKVGWIECKHLSAVKLLIALP